MLDVQSLVKYMLEGLAVAAAAYYIPRKTVDLKEIAMIAVTAAAVFAVLDQFAPAVSSGARQGAGFGIGYNITSGLEGFDSDDDMEEEAMPGPDDSSEDESEDSEDTDSEDDYIPDAVGGSDEPFASVL
jgi:hypothetical protein